MDSIYSGEDIVKDVAVKATYPRHHRGHDLKKIKEKIDSIVKQARKDIRATILDYCDSRL